MKEAQQYSLHIVFRFFGVKCVFTQMFAFYIFYEGVDVCARARERWYVWGFVLCYTLSNDCSIFLNNISAFVICHNTRTQTHIQTHVI